MSQDNFKRFMSAIDPDLLEEAALPRKKRVYWREMAAAAACLCLVIGAAWIAFGQPAEAPDRGIMMLSAGNTDLPAFAEIGCDLVLPEDAEILNVEKIVPLGGMSMMAREPANEIAEVAFISEDAQYVCRASRTDSASNVSGLYAEEAENLAWNNTACAFSLNTVEDDTSWIEWYDAEQGISWSLSGEDVLPLMDTARKIMNFMGYDMAVAPEGSEDVSFRALKLDEMTVGETSFVLQGKHFVYRMAATDYIGKDFPDLSEMDGEFDCYEETTVRWCPARICFDEGGRGKIVWFDVVPGMVYSLSVDSGASRDSLLDMAQTVFCPMQDDAG